MQDSQTFSSEQDAIRDSSDFGLCAFKLSSTIPKTGCPKPRTHKASFSGEAKPRVCTAAIVPMTGHSTRSICCRPQPARHMTPSTKHQAPSTKHRIPRAKRAASAVARGVRRRRASTSAAGTQAPQTLYLDNFILAENLEVYVRAPDFAKSSAHRALGDMRHVAVARKVRKREFP